MLCSIECFVRLNALFERILCSSSTVKKVLWLRSRLGPLCFFKPALGGKPDPFMENGQDSKGNVAKELGSPSSYNNVTFPSSYDT